MSSDMVKMTNNNTTGEERIRFSSEKIISYVCFRQHLGLTALLNLNTEPFWSS